MFAERSQNFCILALALTIKDNTVPIDRYDIGLSSQILQDINDLSSLGAAHGDVRVEVSHILNCVTNCPQRSRAR